MSRGHKDSTLDDLIKRDKINSEHNQTRTTLQSLSKEMYKIYGEYLANLKKPYPKEMVEEYRAKRKAEGTA